MRYADAAAFRMALEQRLKNLAEDDGARLARDRKRIAFVTIATIPLERHIAEKLHAYSQVYARGRTSTRTKDLVDLALLAELSTLDACALRTAIDQTFYQRALHPIPTRLPSPPDSWRRPFRELADATGIPTDLVAGHAAAAALLDPILGGEVVAGTWDPGDRCWAVHHPSGTE